MTTSHCEIGSPHTETPESSTRRTGDVALVQLSFDELSVEAARMQGQLSDLQNKIAAMKKQLTSAADETLARVDDKGGCHRRAPAIILPKQLERNHKVPGTPLIYMGVLDHPRVGRPINLFTSQNDFGVISANGGMEVLGKAKSWEGHDGLQLGKDYGYEDRVFEAWKDGRRMDRWVVMPMVVLAGRSYPGEDKIFDGNLFDNRNESDLKGTLNTSGSANDAKWYWSCTEVRDFPDTVWSVRPSDGNVDWHHRDGLRSSVRPCLAQELNHLAL